MRCHPCVTGTLWCSPPRRQHATLYRKLSVSWEQGEYSYRCKHSRPTVTRNSLSTAACGDGDDAKCPGEKNCTGTPKDSPIETTVETDEAVGSWFARCISIIGCGALLSKVLGLLREQLISSYLGLTGLADAFNLASTFPVLCLTGIGGLNGALHSATASTAAQLPQSNDKGRTGGSMLEFISVSNTRLGLATCAFSLALAVAANPVVQIIAPGLSQQHHVAAVIMLRIMSPVLILSGWIGVSLGALVSQKRIFAPSLVPVVGNMAFIGIMLLNVPNIGPVQLGLASLGSAVAQWVLLSGAMVNAGFPMMMRWGGQAAGNLFGQLIGAASPVLLTTCALHGAAWTDLAVSSYVPGAAASMSYAYILGLAPYGIIAGSVLTPLLRSLSMADEKGQLQLLQVTVCSLARIMIPMAVLISCMAPHLVTIALSGGVFAAAEVSVVAQLLPLVQASALFGVVRDVLMRVHYVRGTGWRVLQLNVFLLVANLGLDIAALGMGLGAYGLLASTVLINFCAFVLVWGAVPGAPEKLRECLTGLGKILVTGVLTAASWLIAKWLSPVVLDFIWTNFGSVSGGGMMLGETLSRFGAALACAAFSLPMAVSYVVLYGAWYLLLRRITLKRQVVV